MSSPDVRIEGGKAENVLFTRKIDAGGIKAVSLCINSRGDLFYQAEVFVQRAGSSGADQRFVEMTSQEIDIMLRFVEP